ncbi:MAG: carbonic anhydrase [Alphaproteobacteria bacterium]
MTLQPRFTAHHTDERSSGTSRRAFIRLASLAAGVAAFGLTLPIGRAQASATEALLLSCMDYRLIDDMVRYMDGRGLTDKYDHVVLAGASLGALTDKYPAWGRTFFEHVEVAISLHRIKKLMVIDHRDCGAYKVILGPDSTKDPDAERAAHQAQLFALREVLNGKHPGLEVELLLMALDGAVEAIG